MGSSLIIRFWEIDMMRGVAIIMMVIFHILFQLNFLGIVELELYSGAFFFFWLPIPLIFLLLVGISMTLKSNSYQMKLKEEREKRKENGFQELSLTANRFSSYNTSKKIYVAFIGRGLLIFFFGLIITAVTWLVFGDRFIIFGILHLIGLSIMIAIPFVEKKWYSFFMGIVLIVTGLLLRTIRVDNYWLLFFGVRPVGFSTLDYFPLLPWLGVVLIGIFIGNSLYANNKRHFPLPEISDHIVVKTMGLLGRHSLLIYLIHQPMIIVTFILMGLVSVEEIFSA